MYISYSANNAIWMAQMASDLKSEVKSQLIYTPPSNVGKSGPYCYLDRIFNLYQAISRALGHISATEFTTSSSRSLPTART